MIFISRPPHPGLAAFIDRVWFFSGAGLPHRMERVLPDGSAELVIDLNQTPRRRFDPVNPRRFTSVRHSWISGIQPSFIQIDVLPSATLMGAHFRPGGLAHVIRMPASELCGQLVELCDLFGSAAAALRESLFNTTRPATKLQLLEGFLLTRIVNSLPPDPLITAAIDLLSRTAPPAISDLAPMLGISHKHFIHRFRARVGLEPKRFSRIQRFKRTMQAVQIQPPSGINWADVAAGSGYADQAHLIHEFNSFAGLSPRQYLETVGADDRFVPLPG